MSNLIQLTKDEKARFTEWVVQNVTDETVLCDERNLGAMLFNLVHLIHREMSIPSAVGPVNLNTYVRFKMKPRGVAIVRAYWEQFTKFPNESFPIDQPDVECRVQLHELFRLFGGMNMRLDFEGSPIYGLIIESMPF